MEGGSKLIWSTTRDLRETLISLELTSGSLGRFSNCVSLLERADKIGVTGRASRYVGPVEVD